MNHRTYVMSYIREIAELLDFSHGSPNHNNKKDPLDELIFILLSRRTRDGGYESAYNNLKKKFTGWGEVANANSSEIFPIIEHAGFGTRRSKEIIQILRTIYSTFGCYSLDKLKRWNDERVFAFLTSLEGVGPKSAYCIMMFSLGRKVFPVDTHVNRICQRLGIIDMGIDHKKAQVLLENVFPKPLRYCFHVNMVAHGRKICLPTNPLCDNCLISGFCMWKRIGNKNTLGHCKLKFADLFSGAGGMSLGLERVGFNLCFAIDSNFRACSTMVHNRTYLVSDKIINKNIENVDPRKYVGKGIKVIVAGPPCQEFSPVRKNGFGEIGRKELYIHILHFVSVIKPVFVVIENVPGMASSLNKVYVKRVEEGLRELGYAVKSEIINSKYFGIPQNRSRLFFIARRVYRGSLKSAEGAVNRVWERIYLSKKSTFVTFRQGVSGLPKLCPGEGADILSGAERGRPSNYARKMMESSNGIIFNHIARKHNPRDIEAYKTMDEGDNAIDLHKKRPDLMPYSTNNFHTKFYKIRADKTSPTIVAHLRKDANSFIHPRDSRGISPREAARLQSFPDYYRFLGTFGLQFEQIGNAVPPLLSEVIGAAIKEELVKNGGIK